MLAGGDNHVCALSADQHIRCWGSNQYGQLGLGLGLTSLGSQPGEMGDELPTVDLGAGVTPVALASSHDAVCVLVTDGRVKCWGDNENGQLGLGDTQDRGDDPGEMGDALPFVDLGGRATQLTGGGNHVCALLDDGRIKCWGGNGLGSLGLGDTKSRGDNPGEMGDALPAVDLGAGLTPLSVTTGLAHTCAVFTTGQVKCWGSSSQGKLGLGDSEFRGDGPGEMGDALPFVDLGTGIKATGLVASGGHTCALLDDGRVKCWGNGPLLGLGSSDIVGHQPGGMGDALPFVDLGSSLKAVALRTMGNHTCALLTDGRVKCWGDGSFGQLGFRGASQIEGDKPEEMGDALPFVNLGAQASVIDLTTTSRSTCALLHTGKVKCWGNNGSGQLGLGDTTNRGDDPGEMGDLLPFVDLGSGSLLGAGGAAGAGGSGGASGSDGAGAAGPGTGGAGGDSSSTGGASSGTAGASGSTGGGGGQGGKPLGVTQVAAGYKHTCALLDDGRVKCWGTNAQESILGLGFYGPVGAAPGQMGDALPPVDLGSGLGATSVVSNFSHTCAVLSTGDAKCWGANDNGQLGLGHLLPRGDNPWQMGDALASLNLGAGTKVASLALGAFHTCALLADGRVKCWGNNLNGQLGIGDTASRGYNPGEMGDLLPALDLGAGLTVSSLTTGSSHTCALFDDGRIKCWGGNHRGQLGLGDSDPRGDGPGEMGDHLPFVDLGAKATAVSAQYDTTCALLSDGRIKCWGQNLHVLGDVGADAHSGDAPGEMGDALPAVDLGSGATAVALATSERHVCALLSDGHVKCWGHNASGQLGLGDANHRGDAPGELGDALPFVDLGAGAKALGLAVGWQHSCALLAGKRLKCWGMNYAQLGLGDTYFRGDDPGEMGDTLPFVDVGTQD